MLNTYSACARTLQRHEPTGPGWTPPADTAWIDLLNPTREEELAVESAVGLSLPTREEMAEIEASSRLYRENGATFVTANLLVNTDSDLPASGPVTFVLTGGPLITIRYLEPRGFRMLTERVEREPQLCGSGAAVFLNLMEHIVDRTADVLERNAAEVEALSLSVFADRGAKRYEAVLTRLGRQQLANAKIRDSLLGLSRAFTFIGLDERVEHHAEAREHLASLSQDSQSLIDHAAHVSSNITFLLEAALGLINIQQSSIIKIFSVAAVAFLPPTLIASIYGMNFDHMPELASPAGYPLAVAAMLVSAVLPLLWFRRKGWL